MLTAVTSSIPSVDFEWAFSVRPCSLYISYCNIVTRKGLSVSFNKSTFDAVRVLCAQHLDFSEEKPLEADLLLLPAEAKHFNFISTALSRAFQVVRTVKVLFSLGLFCIIFKGHFLPREATCLLKVERVSSSILSFHTAAEGRHTFLAFGITKGAQRLGKNLAVILSTSCLFFPRLPPNFH